MLSIIHIIIYTYYSDTPGQVKSSKKKDKEFDLV